MVRTCLRVFDGVRRSVEDSRTRLCLVPSAAVRNLCRCSQVALDDTSPVSLHALKTQQFLAETRLSTERKRNGNETNMERSGNGIKTLRTYEYGTGTLY